MFGFATFDRRVFVGNTFALWLWFAGSIPSGAQTQVVVDVPLTAGVAANAPETFTVQQGDQVVLRVTSDIALELHLHGYDIPADVRPNEVTEMRFTARFTGRFPLAAHVDGNDRNVGYVEVHPK